MIVSVEYLPVQITPDSQRLLSRFFDADCRSRRAIRIARVLSLTEDETERIVSDLLQQYARAHHDIAAIWQEHFQRVQPYLPAGQPPLKSHAPATARGLFHHGLCPGGRYTRSSIRPLSPHWINRTCCPGQRAPPSAFARSVRVTSWSIIVRTGIVDAEHNITLSVPSPTQQALVGEPDPALDIASIPAYPP